MSSQFGSEHESKQRERQPGPKMGMDAANQSVCSQLQDHRVTELERSDPALADYDSRVTIDELPAPTQLCDRAVDRVEQDTQILAAAEHNVARQR